MTEKRMCPKCGKGSWRSYGVADAEMHCSIKQDGEALRSMLWTEGVIRKETYREEYRECSHCGHREEKEK